jgi:hypothetical protein
MSMSLCRRSVASGALLAAVSSCRSPRRDVLTRTPPCCKYAKSETRTRRPEKTGEAIIEYRNALEKVPSAVTSG